MAKDGKRNIAKPFAGSADEQSGLSVERQRQLDEFVQTQMQEFDAALTRIRPKPLGPLPPLPTWPEDHGREVDDLTQRLEDATPRHQERNRNARSSGPSGNSTGQEREQVPENPVGVGSSGDSAVRQREQALSQDSAGVGSSDGSMIPRGRTPMQDFVQTRAQKRLRAERSDLSEDADQQTGNQEAGPANQDTEDESEQPAAKPALRKSSSLGRRPRKKAKGQETAPYAFDVMDAEQRTRPANELFDAYPDVRTLVKMAEDMEMNKPKDTKNTLGGFVLVGTQKCYARASIERLPINWKNKSSVRTAACDDCVKARRPCFIKQDDLVDGVGHLVILPLPADDRQGSSFGDLAYWVKPNQASQSEG